MRKDMSNGRVLLGSLVCPVVALMMLSTHDLLCIGPFIIATLLFWLILFLRGREMFRNISGH